MALPALSRTYHAHANVPFPDVSTGARIWQSWMWLFKACLKGEVTTGTQSGTRSAGSLWTHVASCDGSTVSTGTDLWGSTFDASKLVMNFSGSAHSWWKGTNGIYDIVLDLNSTSNGIGRLALSAAGTFSAGTITAGPTAAADFYANSTVNANSATTATHYTDHNIFLSAPRYFHFITNSTDYSFLVITSRPGTNCFSSLLGLQKTTGAQVGDNYNVFWLHQVSSIGVSGRGNPSLSSMVGASCIQGRNYNNSAIMGTAGLGRKYFGGQIFDLNMQGADVLNNEYSCYPLPVREIGLASKRGYLIDIYGQRTMTVGSSLPLGGTQERMVVGDLVVPWPVVKPLI